MRAKASKISIMLMAILIVSKALGFLRDMLIARSFGSGMETDAYFIAVTAATIFFAIVGYALSTIIIPVMSDIQGSRGTGAENRYVNNMLHLVTFFTVVISCLAYFFAPVIIRVLASGFSGEKFDLAVRMTRIGVPIMIFNGYLSIMKGYLHVHGEFRVPALEGFATSLPIIFYLIFLSERFGITGLMAVLAFTWLLRVFMYVPAVRKQGFRYQPVVDFRDNDLRKTLLLTGPVLLGTFSNYINLVVDRTIASRLAESSISALSYANRVKDVVIELLVLTIITVVYAMISRNLSNGDNKGFHKSIGFGTNMILLVAVPSSVGLVILSKPLTMLLFQRGAFTAADTGMTASALSFYAIGITFLAVGDLINKVFFAMKDTKTPMYVGIAAVSLNIILNIILSRVMAHDGLALATSITAVASMLVLIVIARRKIPGLDIKGSLVTLLKVLLSSAIMGAAVFFANKYVFNTVTGRLAARGAGLLAIIFIGVLIYAAAAYVIRIEEVVSGLGRLAARIKTLFVR